MNVAKSDSISWLVNDHCSAEIRVFLQSTSDKPAATKKGHLSVAFMRWWRRPVSNPACPVELKCASIFGGTTIVQERKILLRRYAGVSATCTHKKGPPNGGPGLLVEAAGIEPGALDDAEICVDIR